MAISKLTLIGGSAGLISATAGGVAVYLNSGESVKDHIENKFESHFKFISEVPESEVALKARYAKDGENKPKKGNATLSVDEIVSWCKSSANTKFSTETDPTYLSLETWCFVNTTSLSEKAKKNKASNREYVSNNDGNDEAWKTAWEAYNNGKSTSNLSITDDSLVNLNKTEKDAGARDLYEWCKKTGNIKEYEVDSETTYTKYEKWCFKTNLG